jgi:hypothetical protein
MPIIALRETVTLARCDALRPRDWKLVVRCVRSVQRRLGEITKPLEEGKRAAKGGRTQ